MRSLCLLCVFCVIICPKIILEIGLIAEQFKVPDGVAFIRLKDVGVLIENKNGFLEMPSPKPKGKSKWR